MKKLLSKDTSKYAARMVREIKAALKSGKAVYAVRIMSGTTRKKGASLSNPSESIKVGSITQRGGLKGGSSVLVKSTTGVQWMDDMKNLEFFEGDREIVASRNA